MSKVIGVMKCKDSSVPDFMVTTMRLVDDNEGYAGIKDDGEEYHVYREYWDFKPLTECTLQNGAVFDEPIGMQINEFKCSQQSLNASDSDANINGIPLNKITATDVEVVKYDPTKLDIESLVTERGNRYGKFADGAKIMRSLKAVMHNTDGWSRLTDSQREALDMIQHKIGRILNGDPAYDDNWKDIAGYSKLIADELNGDIK